MPEQADATQLRAQTPLPQRGDLPIAIDSTPVPCRGEALSPILWRGRQWAVTEHGLECLNGLYDIPADFLASGLPDFCWLEHIAQKIWVDTEDLATAWLVALALHGQHVPPAQLRAAIARSWPPREAKREGSPKTPKSRARRLARARPDALQ